MVQKEASKDLDSALASGCVADLMLGLQQGAFSTTELTDACLSKARDAQALNSLITICDEEARDAAKKIDTARASSQRSASGPPSALEGLPIAHKDIFCTEGVLTTCGSKMLSNFVAPYSATVVERLQAAGTVTLGKCNMDEFAMGSSNENSFFGPVKNPWDLNRVPGGSSGGSAAAVAAGIIPVATGTDTGGSIRQPASFCGVTGIKPTYGRVSRFGMVAFASSLDQGGVFARSADDAARVLGAMAGFDERDSTCAQDTADELRAVTQTGLEVPTDKLTIGLPKEYFADLTGELATLLDDARAVLEAQGHSVREIELPNTRFAIPSYYVISGAEASTNLSRYDGVRYGHRCENPSDLNDLYTRTRSEGFGAEVQRRILTGTYALSVGYFDAYYLKAQKLRRLIQQDFLSAFNDVDVMLAPVTPGPAFEIGNLTDDPVQMYQQDIFTVPASLAGLPAASIPCGFIDDLPMGMQLIAPHFDDLKLMQLAHQYQQHTDWHNARPPQAVAAGDMS